MTDDRKTPLGWPEAATLIALFATLCFTVWVIFG